MSKFTPRPWEIDYEFNRILAMDRRSTIVVGSFGGSLANPVVLADARLIAAAPAMYEALEGMRSMYVSMCRARGWKPEHSKEYVATVAALKAATGE